MKKNNLAFTLVELVVAFTITTFVLSWAMFFFSQVVDWVTDLTISSNLFTWTDNLDKLISSYQKDYKYNEIYNLGSSVETKWADILLLKNDSTTPTAWVLFWVYNNTDSQTETWNYINYKDYKLFYKELDNTAINSLISSWISSYTGGLTLDNINIISDLNIIKFWVSKLEWKIKIDLRLTPIYYDKLEWLNINVFDKNEEAEDYYITLLK